MSRNQIRNIGISAHIDSGKTTLSERILFYTGRIHIMGEVWDEVRGATMDYLPEEKAHGITITSAATTCQWGDTQINLIDTPGHVDFTIEVERSLRVLDGAVMVLCAVGGVQSQSITVDRQMKRYHVPRIAWINKLDRVGANPFAVVQAMRDRIGLHPVVLQYPMGSEDQFVGLIDLIEMTAHFYEGEYGEQRVTRPIPPEFVLQAQEAREKMLDALSLVSEPLTERLLNEEEILPELIWATVRQATLQQELTPVLMGSALHNQGVQDLLDAIARYLPSPDDREQVQATDVTTGEWVTVTADPQGPLVALAFKLTVESFGQLTYFRLYSGTLTTGERVWNSRTRTLIPVGRLVRLHANKREEVQQAQAGDIVALVGSDCASGDTLCSEGTQVSLESMFVPDPVVTLAIAPQRQEDSDRLAKALDRFQREDPTFHVQADPDSNQTLISGMGELHLNIYLERLQREYHAQVYVGQPAVAYRETITRSAQFDYVLERQTGHTRQFAQVSGRLEPCEQPFAFENRIAAGTMPKPYLLACEQGFRDALGCGRLAGYPVTNLKVTLVAGTFHPLESSEFAFRIAAQQAFDQAFAKAAPRLLEPIMRVEVETPQEYVGRLQGDLSARRGLLLGSETMQGYVVLWAEVPLAQMFGYASAMRSLTSGMGSFTMEFACYRLVPSDDDS